MTASPTTPLAPAWSPSGCGAAPISHWQPLLIGKSERAALKHQKPAILWLTGLSGAGKSTIANLVEQRLHVAGYHTMLLDGDNVRHGLCRDLGFTEADRVENIRRAGEVAKLMTEAGLIVFVPSFRPIAPSARWFEIWFATGEFIEVFVDTPIEECIRGIRRASTPKPRPARSRISPAIDAPYEAPESPEIHLRTVGHAPEQLAEYLLDALVDRAITIP